MAWSNSRIFAQTILDGLDGTAAIDLDTGTAADFMCAIYGNTITPDNTVAATATAYNNVAGVWDTDEKSDTTEWDAGGEPIVAPDLTKASAVLKWDDDGTNVVSGGSSATLAAVFGCLCYNGVIASPVADQGICYNYFGGTNSVTNGTFTVVFAAAGIFTLTLT